MHKFSFHMVISAALLYGNSVEAIQNWVFALGLAKQDLWGLVAES